MLSLCNCCCCLCWKLRSIRQQRTGAKEQIKIHKKKRKKKKRKRSKTKSRASATVAANGTTRATVFTGAKRDGCRQWSDGWSMQQQQQHFWLPAVVRPHHCDSLCCSIITPSALTMSNYLSRRRPKTYKQCDGVPGTSVLVLVCDSLRWTLPPPPPPEQHCWCCCCWNDDNEEKGTQQMRHTVVEQID